jgi:hypothetical protein
MCSTNKFTPELKKKERKTEEKTAGDEPLIFANLALWTELRRGFWRQLGAFGLPLRGECISISRGSGAALRLAPAYYGPDLRSEFSMVYAAEKSEEQFAPKVCAKVHRSGQNQRSAEMSED